MEGDIYDIDGRYIYVDREDVWPHVVHIDVFSKVFINGKLALLPERLPSVNSFSRFGVCPYYIYDEGLMVMLYFPIAGGSTTNYSFGISEVLTRGGVFLRSPEEILSWLLEERAYLVGEVPPDMDVPEIG